MFKNSLISLIIPTFNRINYLKKCIESIKNQKYKNYEIILIDDNSKECLEALKPLCNIFIRNIVNMGPSYSRNLGAIHSKGKILVFLDSDTELLSESLEKLPAIFNNNSAIAAIGGSGPPNRTGVDVRYVTAKSYDCFGRSRRSYYYPLKEARPFKLYDCHHIQSAYLAIRRDIFFSVGGFDPYWHYGGEDRDLCLRIKDNGYRIVVSLEARAIHYIATQDNPVRNLKNYKQFMNEKFLQVSIKRNGISGGLKWVIFNFKEIGIYNSILIMRQFLKYHKLAARREINFLYPSNMNLYSQYKILDNLKENNKYIKKLPLDTPNNITIFVTDKCNAFCDHCFICSNNKKKSEINIDNIITCANSLNKPTRISLTGGEPFFKKNIGEIINELMKIPQIENLAVTSNGSLPDKIENICQRITHLYNKHLHVQISLDGLEEMNNSIRKIPNGFNNAIETCKKLHKIMKNNKNFSYIVGITIMKQNLSNIENLVEYLLRLNYPSKISIVRGNSFSTFNVPEDILDIDYEPNLDCRVDITEVKKLLNKISNKHPNYFDKYQKRKLQIMIDTLYYKKRQIICYAGYENAVIYGNGNISLCEQVKPFGNLKKWNWDMIKAWNSEESMEFRKRLRDCFCIHGCNISTAIRKQDKSNIKIAKRFQV